MSSKGVKTRKRSSKAYKTKTKNSQAEVFVLPPDLLQKLGINLEHVNNNEERPANLHTEDATSVQYGTEVLVKDTEKLLEQSKLGDQTILETASLMKKSVLLSPAFAATGSCEHLKVFERTEVTKTCNSDIIDLIDRDASAVENDSISQNEEILYTSESKNDVSPSSVDLQSEINTEQPLESNNSIDKNIIQTHEDNQFVVNNHVTNILGKSTRALSIDDHPDEAYSSDCSNSNLGSMDTPEIAINHIPNQFNSMHSLILPPPNEFKNKINIIREEIITSAQIKELESLCSSNFSGSVPISMNSLIKKISMNNKNTELINVTSLEQKMVKNDDAAFNTDPFSLETIVLFDEKGIVIKNETENLREIFKDMSINDILVPDQIHNLDSTVVCNLQTDMDTPNRSTKTSEHSLGVCLDLVVSDIEMHLKQNEDILEKFAEEITSDNNEILEKIENSEKGCLNKSIKFNDINEVITADKKDGVLGTDKETMNDNRVKSNLSVIQIYDHYVTTDRSSDVSINNTMTETETLNPSLSKQINTENKITKAENTSENKDLCDISCNDVRAQKDLQRKTIKMTRNRQLDSSVPTEGKIEHKNTLSTKKEVHITGKSLTDRTENKTTFMSDQSSDADDKVKEIAMYLNAFVKKHTVKSALANREHMPTKQSKHIHMISKLHIQGVEKPGGHEKGQERNYKMPKNVKTYINVKKAHNKTFPVIPLSVEATKSNATEVETDVDYSETQQHGILNNNTQVTQFCNCGDFGRLAYYDSEHLSDDDVDVYEHIHFRERKYIDCSREIVFSIYSSDLINYEERIFVDVEKAYDVQNKSNTSEHSICWNTFENNREIICEQLDHDIPLSRNNIKKQKTDNCAIKEENEFDPRAEKNINKSADHHKSVIIAESSTIVRPDNSESVDNVIYNHNKNEGMTSTTEIKSNIKNTYTQSSEQRFLENSDDTVVYSTQDSTDDKLNNQFKNKFAQCINDKTTDNEDRNLVEKKTTGVKNDAMCKKESYILSSTCDDNKSDNDNTNYNDLGLNKQDELKLRKETQAKKRKKSSAARQGTEKVDNFEPSKKKTVKCGVCKQVLAENEWTDHMSEHSSITWRAGDSFDLKDNDLVENIQNKLKNVQSLHSPFCSQEYKSTEKFLSHVEDCLKVNVVGNAPIKDSATENIDKAAVDMPAQNIMNDNVSISDKNLIRCAVCKEYLSDFQWLDHIAQAHNYLAWKDNERPLNLDDDDNLWKHLNVIAKQIGSLVCSRCGITRKYPRLFLSHIKYCKDDPPESSKTPQRNKIRNSYVKENSTSEDEPLSTLSSEKQDIKCGVCKKTMTKSLWYEHMSKEHEFLAWEDGKDKLDVNNEEAVRKHLYIISKEYGYLTCSKCGVNYKYVKLFQKHVRTCSGPLEVSVDESITETDGHSDLSKSADHSKCAVCDKHVPTKKWIQHIMNHVESMDVTSEEELRRQLSTILGDAGSLGCPKCDKIYDNVDVYVKHVSTCTVEKMVVCAVCSQQVPWIKWIDHKMNVHYNVAWAVGEEPINVAQSKEIYKLIKEYENQHSLVCRICGITRASYIGFYAHVIVCGKSEEEADLHKKLCSICNKKYLSVYENQHNNYHREQEMRKEDRERKRDVEEREVVAKAQEVEMVPGRRRAAQKAKAVIENYQKVISGNSHTCNCGFGGDTELELRNHNCDEKDFSDSGESVAVSSEEESEDSEVDSNISNDELSQGEDKDDDEEDEGHKKRRRTREYLMVAPKIKRFPFTLDDANSYISKSCDEFYTFYYKPESLFSEWRKCEWEMVPEEQLSNYSSPLEQSCKLRLHEESWTLWSRFEAKNLTSAKLKFPVPAIFVGSCVQSISWVPVAVGDEDSNGHFLTVIGHSDSDLPRLSSDDIRPRPGLIQIWDFGVFDTLPKLALGLVHDFGIAWDMDWCPSGARDAFLETQTEIPRLGLLAVAFSTGSAYIFSVPYPSVIVEDDKLFYKLKPLVELRLTASKERKTQATSISWSIQKKHETVMVGYGDGYTALYDLNTESPLLRSKDNNLTVIYPFHEVRMSNSCVTGVATFPSMDARVPDSVCAASPTGATLLARAGRRPATQHSTVSCAKAHFQPIWPSALLSGEDCALSTNVNEVEWWGSGRRLGAAGAGAACALCGRLALAAPPLLAAARRHPAAAAQPKQLVGAFQMIPLGKNRPKLNKGVKLEPITYEEAVKQYGIEVKLDKKSLDQSTQQREAGLERFPLADVSSMAFCLSPAFHKKLAVALHCGIIFLMQV